MQSAAAVAALLLLVLAAAQQAGAQHEVGTKLAAQLRAAKPLETTLTIGMRVCSDSPSACAELTGAALAAADAWAKGRGGCNVTVAQAAAFKGLPRGRGALETFYKRFLSPKCLTEKMCRDTLLKSVGANATTAKVLFYEVSRLCSLLACRQFAGTEGWTLLWCVLQ